MLLLQAEQVVALSELQLLHQLLLLCGQSLNQFGAFATFGRVAVLLVLHLQLRLLDQVELQLFLQLLHDRLELLTAQVGQLVLLLLLVQHGQVLLMLLDQRVQLLGVDRQLLAQ